MVGIYNAGKGPIVGARVNSEERLEVESVTRTTIQNSGQNGDAYNINTGDIASLANGTSGLIYFKNGEDKDFAVDAIAVGIGDASGNGVHTVTVVKNPTTGTVISGATAVDMNQNRNFGSSKTLADSLAYKGADTLTLTGDDGDVAQFYMNESGRLFATVDFVIPKGSAIGIELTLALSSGTATAYCALIGHLIEDL